MEREMRRKYPKLELIRILGIASERVEKKILECEGVAAECEGALRELKRAYRDLMSYEEGENNQRSVDPKAALSAESSHQTATELESEKIHNPPTTGGSALPKPGCTHTPIINRRPDWSSCPLTIAILEAEMQPVEKIPVLVGYRPTMEIRLAYFPKSLFPSQFSIGELYCVGDPFSVDLGGGLVAYSVPYVEKTIEDQGMAGWWKENLEKARMNQPAIHADASHQEPWWNGDWRMRALVEQAKANAGLTPPSDLNPCSDLTCTF
jgi:hypothetical protein